jgi:hypothetical protein
MEISMPTDSPVTDLLGLDEVGTEALPGFEVAEADPDPVELALAGLDPTLRTPSVRAALVDRAQRQRIIDKALQAVEESKAALAAAVGQGRIHDAVELAARAAGADVVASMLPNGDLDLSACGDAFQLAVEAVNLALEAVPVVEPLSFTLEVRAWKSLPSLWHGEVESPVRTPEVAGLEAEIALWATQLAGIAKGVQQRQTELAAPDGGGLQLLGTTRGLADGIYAAAEAGRDLAARVADANRQRRESGLEFSLAKTPKIPLDQFTSEEIRQLQKQRRLVAVP